MITERKEKYICSGWFIILSRLFGTSLDDSKKGKEMTENHKLLLLIVFYLLYLLDLAGIRKIRIIPIIKNLVIVAISSGYIGLTTVIFII